MTRRMSLFGVFLFLASFPFTTLSAQPIDPALLAGMKARSIGPAGMSGRTAAIDAVAANPNIIYIGAATGGVWKSENGGLTWDPIFDQQPVAAIGAVSIFQANPDIVWVGTGEGNPRNSASVGNGIYKSIDSGETWTHLGLEKTERIHRILLHPSNPDIAYVCAMGQAWGENPERGVYKTTDGGNNWNQILFVNDATSCSDLAMDPSNPDKLLAGMWQYRRWPWHFKSGGPGSGLFLTVDGGRNWKPFAQEDGLPEGELGRIGVAFAPSNPEIVYALVEAQKSALLRSADGARNWRKVNQENDIAPRPFYYTDLRVDPQFPNRVYNLHSLVTVSDDGGKSFHTLIPFRNLHPDHHAMWINPSDGRHILSGNDGGVGISHDRGETWRFVRNLPLAQFYHVRLDMDQPYNIYGGLQDNGSWRGPSSVWEGGFSGGIRNLHWTMVAFGDGFDTLPDPEDSTRGYAMSQGGNLYRWNLRTGEGKVIRPDPPQGTKLRFNWNAGIAQDPFDSATIYYGSQFVHKSTDRGESWSIISPDLTTNNPEWQKQEESGGLTPDVTAAENFTTILSIAPSPLQKGLIWVGTDDGRLHVTRDGGDNWTSVEQNVPGVPPNTWIPHVTPSPHDAATAFVVFDNHRRSDWTPYLYKTTDYGNSWQSLATSDIRGYALKMEQDPVHPDLLFLGTEFGLFVSLNGGSTWFPWRHGVPTVSVMDLAIHAREHDLVIATHGRALYVLDDIRPLRTLSAEVLQKPLHLFEIADTQQYRPGPSPGELIPGNTEFRGQNRPYGALITFSLNAEDLPHPDQEIEKARKRKEREAKKSQAEPRETETEGEPDKPPEKGPQVEVEISDAAGNSIRTFKHKAYQGLNRLTWNLRSDEFERPKRDGEEESFFDSGGPEVIPGTYNVTLKFRNQEATTSVRVLPDPRFPLSDSQRLKNWEAIQYAGKLQETATKAIERIRSARRDMELITAKLKKEQENESEGTDQRQNLLKEAAQVQEALTRVEKRLWQPPDTKGIVADNDAFSKIRSVLRSLQSSWDPPAPPQEAYLEQASELLQEVLDEFNQLFATEVAEFRRKARENQIELLATEDPLTVPR